MHKSKIEWVLNPDNKTLGWVWNPITGCLNGCSYCYARKLANGRLKSKYLASKNISRLYLDTPGDEWQAKADPFYPRFWEDRLAKIDGLHGNNMKLRGVFVCDMGDLFGAGVPKEWTEEVLRVCRINSWHRFYLLTKQPQNLIKLSPFPPNCWVGVTATDSIMFAAAYFHLKDIVAKVKYISMEPLLDWDERVTKPMIHQALQAGVNWIIIGQQTPIRKSTMPKAEWVENIIYAAMEAGIPVWLKDNLVDALPPTIPFYVPPLEVPAKGEIEMVYRQEIPK